MAKKKTRSLTSIQKAVAKACNMEMYDTAKVKENIASVKKYSKEIKQIFGMNEPMDIPQFTDSGRKFYEKCQKDDNVYASVVRNLVIGHWLSNKVVYRIPEETIAFLHERFPIKESDFNINTLLLNACRTPIYLEFQGNGTSASGAFCSCTMLMQGGADRLNLRKYTECPGLFACILDRQEDAYIFGYRTESCSVREGVGNAHQELSDNKEDGRTTILEVLAYIGYLRGHADAMGTALVPDSFQGGECYQVLPVPFEDSIPDLGQPSGWFRCGLCAFSDFLSRDNMLEDARQRLDKWHWKPGTPVKRLNDDSLEQAFYAAMLDWERSKVIYQYDSKTRDALHDKYLDAVMLEGIGKDLMDFLPHNVMMFAPDDCWDVTLVAKCKLEDSNVPGLFMVVINGQGISCAAFPCDRSPLSGLIHEAGSQAMGQMSDALCVMYHILSVMRQKTLKQWERENREGISHHSQKEHKRPVDATARETGPVREGYSIGSAPIQLYDLTARTVKRVSDQETLRRSGWKMIPHVRRRHPHRYWVGSGANRHLEVRWLEDMHIHGDEGQENPAAVVVHSVKS